MPPRSRSAGPAGGARRAAVRRGNVLWLCAGVLIGALAATSATLWYFQLRSIEAPRGAFSGAPSPPSPAAVFSSAPDATVAAASSGAVPAAAAGVPGDGALTAGGFPRAGPFPPPSALLRGADGALPGPAVPAPPPGTAEADMAPTSAPRYKSGAREGVLRVRDGLGRFWFETEKKTGLTTPGRRYISKVLRAAGYSETRDAEDSDVRWVFTFDRNPPQTPRRRFPAKYALGPRRLVNHTPNDAELANKDAFLDDLVAYNASTGCDYRQVHPESFWLAHPANCVSFAMLYARAPEADRGRLDWFRKRVGASGGHGISIASLSDVARNDLGGWDGRGAGGGPATEADAKRACGVAGGGGGGKGKKRPKRGRMLVQRQVVPMLLDGRKFEMRVYLLVASFSPLRVFYQPGYARRSQHEYNPDSRVKGVHVLNTVSDGGVRLKWPFRRDFKAYVVRHYGADVWWRVFEVGVRRAVMHSFRAARHRFRDCLGENQGPRGSARPARCWNLIGLDVLASRDLQLKVLEWNASPGMIKGNRNDNAAHVDTQERVVLESLRLVAEAAGRDEDAAAGREVPPRHEWQSADQFQLMLSEEGDAGAPPYVWEGVADPCFRQEPLARPVLPQQT